MQKILTKTGSQSISKKLERYIVRNPLQWADNHGYGYIMWPWIVKHKWIYSQPHCRSSFNMFDIHAFFKTLNCLHLKSLKSLKKTRLKKISLTEVGLHHHEVQMTSLKFCKLLRFPSIEVSQIVALSITCLACPGQLSCSLWVSLVSELFNHSKIKIELNL